MQRFKESEVALETRTYIQLLEQNVSETGFCLRHQVEPTQLGPFHRASPCLRWQNPVSKT
jgi:hypothetical protein